MRRWALLWMLLALLWPAVALGQLQPENVLVVINIRSRDSIEIGSVYVEKRGIPSENVVRLLWGGSISKTTWDSFERSIFGPVMNHIRENNLEGRIRMILLTRGLPYSVNNEAATWMFYAHGVRMERWNRYFGKLVPLRPIVEGDRIRYPAMMLTAFSKESALALIERGAASDGTHPTGTVYFLRGGPYRGVRYQQMPDVAAELELMGIRSELLPGSSIENKPDVLGYMTGASRVSTKNTFLPGAFAEHMTSFAGRLYDKRGQMSILEFIEAGAIGSCGAVDEPTNDAGKFPHALFYVSYANGFTLGEALWQSLSKPYQMICVGDPLAAPFRKTSPGIEVRKVEPIGEGQFQVTLKAGAGEQGHRLQGVLFVTNDGTRAVFPEVNSDTRVVLSFTGRWGNPKKVQVETLLKKRESPAAALERLAQELNARNELGIQAAVTGQFLALVYVPNSAMSPTFTAQCESAEGEPPAWLPTAKTCGFVGQSPPRSAKAFFSVKGTAKRDMEVRLRVDEHRVPVAVTEGTPALEILQALAAAFDGEDVTKKDDGVRIEVTPQSNGWARVAIVAKQPGTEWNGHSVSLSAPRNGGLYFNPYEGTAKMLGGCLATPGRFVLGLQPNPLPVQETVEVRFGDRTVRVVSKGDELSPELLRRLSSEIRNNIPDTHTTLVRDRIILKSTAEEPPALSVSNTSDLFKAEFLGGRWAELRTFPKEEGVISKPPAHKWIAFLRVRVGYDSAEFTTRLDVSQLPDEKRNVTFHAVYDGLFPTTAVAHVDLSAKQEDGE